VADRVITSGARSSRPGAQEDVRENADLQGFRREAGPGVTTKAIGAPLLARIVQQAL